MPSCGLDLVLARMDVLIVEVRFNTVLSVAEKATLIDCVGADKVQLTFVAHFPAMLVAEI